MSENRRGIFFLLTLYTIVYITSLFHDYWDQCAWSRLRAVHKDGLWDIISPQTWGYRGGSPTAVRPSDPALCGSCPL